MNSSLTPSVSFSISFTRQANGDFMKVYLDEIELWPVYTLDPDDDLSWGDEVEVEASFFNEYTEIMDKFDEMQMKLREMYSGNKKSNE
jgi:hypothetical protein